MCGITGIYSFEERIDRDFFEKLNDTLTHRGPDESGIWISPTKNMALGFRRLAIIDTGTGASQPIINEEGNITVVCNGEIYNYQEIKEILIKSGHIFSGTSDAEVIVHGYEEWGDEVFSQLNGMFSIAIADEKNKRLLLARDRFGIKPLYYQITKDKILFGSELRPLLMNQRPQLNPFSIINFLIYRYVPCPDTIFEGIQKLPPAACIQFDGKGKQQMHYYWDHQFGSETMPAEAFQEEAENLLRRSVKEHLNSAVPTAGFLSGGYDSSLIAMLMKESGNDAVTYSLGFKDWEGSEAVYAQQVAECLGLVNKNVLLSESDFLSDEVISAWDEPIADISVIPTWHVARLAAAQHKVVLSGDGADEIFAGYNWYYDVAEQLSAMKKSLFIRPKKHQKAFEIYCRYAAMGLFDLSCLKESLHPGMHPYLPEDPFWLFRKFWNISLPPVKALQALDIQTFLPELILPKMDRASMAHSLEVRVPFLDHRLASFVLNHDQDLYFNPTQYKFILRKILAQRIPNHILDRKKQGFVGPDTFYQRPDYYHKLFKNSILTELAIVNPEIFNKLQSQNEHWKLWKLAVLESWAKQFYK
jgi:asparagine synthase (glutamine-hydrolysing)